MKALKVLLVLTLAGAGVASAANWPAWRGPMGDGTCSETGLPEKWSATDNVAWKVRLPERGNSTPVVWGDKVFVTQAVEKEGRRLLLCFDRKDGKLLWQSGATYKEPETTHATNPYCSGSPATDGERVIVNFASAGVFCFDFNGKELWHRDLGKQAHIWGSGTSPVFAGGLCYLNFGPTETSLLVALDPKTGKVVWKHDEPRDEKGTDEAKPYPNPGFYGSWSDPLPRLVDGKPQLLMTYPFRLCAFEPKTGKELWRCTGLNGLVYTSPLFADGIAVGMGGFGGMAVAVKAGGSGDITKRSRLWRHPRCPQRIASGVIHDGHIYIHNDPGTAMCIELKSGDIIWEERLRGSAPTGQNWSSVVLSEGKCYTVNQGGDCFVFKASPKFELLSVNPLGEKVIGSIAVSDGQIFIRGYQNLWCIGARK